MLCMLAVLPLFTFVMLVCGTIAAGAAHHPLWWTSHWPILGLLRGTTAASLPCAGHLGVDIAPCSTNCWHRTVPAQELVQVWRKSA